MYDLPSYVWALVLIGVIGTPAITCLMLYRGAIAAGLSLRTATTVAGMAAAVLGGWLVASGLLARAGAYHQASGQAAPWFGAAVAGTLLGLLLATRIPVVARILAAPGTPARLALPHTLRVVGVTFLLVMAQGHLPAVFALPPGWVTSRPGWPHHSWPGGWPTAAAAGGRCGSTCSASWTWWSRSPSVSWPGWGRGGLWRSPRRPSR
jgi:hypothetical protein